MKTFHFHEINKKKQKKYKSLKADKNAQNYRMPTGSWEMKKKCNDKMQLRRKKYL